MTASTTSLTAGAVLQPWRVRRGGRASLIALGAAVVLFAALALLPYSQGPAVTNKLVSLFALIVVATMWNLLAGYGGLVSIGLQGFIGIGAYTAVLLDVLGVSPYLAVLLAPVLAAALALPLSLLAFRLRAGYFAIGTWVIAETIRLLVVLFPQVGAGAGATIRSLGSLEPAMRQAVTYWCSLMVLAVVMGGVWLFLRGRIGMGLAAVRDDDRAASTIGVPVTAYKRTVFVLSAAGCGAAGAVIALNTLRVQPDNIFGVQWSAVMIFCVIIGGIGSLEGPVIGAVIFFVLQDRFGDYGSWYLITIGLIAIGFALWWREGIWGLVRRRLPADILATGYQLVMPTARSTSVRSGRR